MGKFSTISVYVSSGRKIVGNKVYKVNPLGKVPEDWWF
ncbi:unnamed protein product, partial [marine sediment metagenome]